MTNEAEAAIRALQGASENAEEALWRAVVACQGMPFRTATGLPFTYCLKIGQNGQPNRELLIDRREKSKSSRGAASVWRSGAHVRLGMPTARRRWGISAA